jgi:hypothetical protein
MILSAHLIGTYWVFGEKKMIVNVLKNEMLASMCISIFQNAHEFFTLYKGICKYTMKQRIDLHEEAINLYTL